MLLCALNTMLINTHKRVVWYYNFQCFLEFHGFVLLISEEKRGDNTVLSILKKRTKEDHIKAYCCKVLVCILYTLYIVQQFNNNVL